MINQYFKTRNDTLMLGLEEVSNKKENKENYTKNKNNKSN